MTTKDPEGDALLQAIDRRIAKEDGPRAERLRQARRVYANTLRIAQGGGTPAEARVNAGLSLGQAARVTGLDPGRLAAIEAGATMAAGEQARLSTAYQCAGFVDPTAPADDDA